MKPARKSARRGPADAGEPVSAMEPLLPAASQPRRGELAELALDLTARANRLAGRLSPEVRDGIGALVRGMNCYYSNLIEGHDTHPVEIERALRRDFSGDARQRNLQREAVAHIAVQEMIDAGALPGALPGAPDSAAFAIAIHRAFCERLPGDLLMVTAADGGRVRVVPGALRDRGVAVGRHVAVSAGAVPRFLARWEEAYGLDRIDRFTALMTVGASHHRLLWIHPFLDGNGRVARLQNHALLARLGVGNPLWSVARGLARAVDTYRGLLAAADVPRRGALDGRGARSEAALIDICAFFLRVSLDQVDFMERLIEPQDLLDRIDRHLAEDIAAGRLPRQASLLMRQVLLAGKIERGAVPGLIDASVRTASRVAAALLDAGYLRAAGPRSPLLPAFPATAAERWFPGLFPGWRG